jgi:hypothetical protein
MYVYSYLKYILSYKTADISKLPKKFLENSGKSKRKRPFEKPNKIEKIF